MRDINLMAMEYFEAVARLGSVTRAADELGISVSAVSQQVRLLESQFGVKLFRREKRQLILTLDGDRLFQTATQALSALRNARSAISRQRYARSLTIRVSPSFGVRWLGSRIARFASENPDWNIRVDATPEFSAFDTEAVDLDLRYGLGDWSGLSVTPMMEDFVMPVCSPRYLRELSGQAHDPVGQLANARLIDSVKGLMRWDIWLADQRISLPEVSYPFRFDRSTMSIEMAKESGGIALESISLCLPELQRGELVPFNPDFEVITFPAYWLVCPARHFSRRIVNRFADWLSVECSEHEAAVRNHLESAGATFRPQKTL